MEFGLSEEQRMLQESVARQLESVCPLDVVRKIAADGTTKEDTVWRAVVDQGVHGILIPEEYGGVGLGFLEAVLIAEALAYRIAPVPFAASSVMAPVALLMAGSDAQRDTWLPAIASGDRVVGVGVTEQTGRRDSEGVVAKDGKLTGTAMFVLDGADADAFVIADDGGALHVVEAAAVEREKLLTIDRTRSLAKLTLDGAVAEALPGSTDDDKVLNTMIDVGRLMLAADTLGAAQNMVDQAVEYAKERKQFNRVIGSFQAVKHMCSEMAAQLEPCRSLVWYAAHAVSSIPEEAHVMACHAKAHLAEVGQFVARTATEVHGGMGFTDLLGLHYWFKRIGANRQLLGAPERVREEAAKAQGWA